MNGYLLRALVALALSAFLFIQARGAAAQPQRRRAFQLGTGALLLLAAYNATLMLNASPSPLQTGLAIASMALFAGAIVSLVLSFRSGEMRGERERIASAAREYREQRERAHRPPNDK